MATFLQPSYLTPQNPVSTGDNSDQFNWYGTGKPNKPAPEGFNWIHTGTKPTYAGWTYDSTGKGFASPDAASNDVYGTNGYQNIYTAIPNAAPAPPPAPAPAAAPEPEQPQTQAAPTPFWQTEAGANYRNRLGNEYERLTGALNEVTSQLPYVNYWDEAGVNSIFSQIEALRQMRDDARRYIQSQPYGQAYGPGQVRPNFQGLENRWKSFLKNAAGLKRSQKGERERMNEWGQEWGGELSDLQGQLSGLGLSEYDTWNTISNALKQMQQEYASQGFKMDPSSLGGIFGRADALGGELADWKGRYDEESSRVQEARNRFSDMLNNSMSGLGGLDIYSGEMLTGAEDDITRALREIQGFQSELSPDFGDLISQLQGGQSQIQDLWGQRRQQLQDIMGNASQYGGEITGADLWDEETMRNALDELYGMTGDITRFTGGQAPTFMDQLQEMISGGEGKLNELGEYRTGIESDAQAFLDEIQNQGLDIAGLEGLSPDVQAMLAEMEQYGATQASDELEDIQQWIQADIARQQAQQQAVAQRQREEAAQYNQVTQQAPSALGPALTPSPIWGTTNPFTPGGYGTNEVLRALGLV